jgi:single-stranded-DNA-specific exonuclease
MSTLKAARFERASVLLAVDSGTRAFDVADRAKSLGIDLIIADHHEPPEDGRLPDAIVVNPLLSISGQGRSLAACGVALQVMLALVEARGFEPGKALDRLAGFAAIGTVSDGVPMLHENRAVVAIGCASLCRTRRAGILEILRVAGVTEITGDALAFAMGPRINAFARQVSPGAALRLLLERDPGRAASQAAKIEEAHKQRMQCRDRALEVARGMTDERIDSSVLVLARTDWPAGVIGAVAQSLMQETGKPVFLLNCQDDGLISGSCRGEEVLPALSANAGLLERYGGHAGAAGFLLWSDNLGPFVEAVMEWGEDIPSHPAPRLEIDAMIDPGEATSATYQALSTLAPFGAAHPEPIFAARQMEVACARQFGDHGKHLELRFNSGAEPGHPLRAVWWGAGSRIEDFLPGVQADAAFRIRMDDHAGHANLSLVTEDVVPA